MQEFRVVQCAECQTFQVDIVKKAKKWNCKLCDTNQTVKKIYFNSYAAKDCRERVQEMNKSLHLAKASESEKLVEQLEEDESQEWSDDECAGFKFKQIDSQQEVPIRSIEQVDKYKRFEQELEEQKSNLHQKSGLLFRANPKKLSPSINRSLKSSSSANSSDKPSTYKPTQLPGFSNFHEKPTTTNLRFRPSTQSEPSAKKLKFSDDDFVISQEDLDLIDSLE